MIADSEFYKSTIDNLYDGVYFVDRNKTIIYWNKGAERLTGYSSSDAVGTRCSDALLMHVNDEGVNLCEGQCPLMGTITDGQLREAEIYLHHKDGHRVPVLVRAAPMRDLEGKIFGAVEIFNDNSSKFTMLQRIEDLQKMTLSDPLTNLANRRFIEMSLSSRLDELERYKWPFGIYFIDIDHFKIVNDKYGHGIGDEVLKMVAKTLSHVLRPFDILGRWGGEEFVAVIVNVNDEQLLKVGNRY